MTSPTRMTHVLLAAVTVFGLGAALSAPSIAFADPKAKHDKHAASPAASSSSNPYAPSGVGSGSPQGNGHAPCNGCVGNADDKNPPGQAPNGSDHNHGYECDGNKGVGDKGGNPAHSGCATKTTPPRTPKPSPSPAPSRSASPPSSPSASPTTPPARPSPSTSPSLKPVPSVSPSPPVVCRVGPCVNPPPPPVCASDCLPNTGANLTTVLPLGLLLLVSGALLLVLMRLAGERRELKRLGG